MLVGRVKRGREDQPEIGNGDTTVVRTRLVADVSGPDAHLIDRGRCWVALKPIVVTRSSAPLDGA